MLLFGRRRATSSSTAAATSDAEVLEDIAETRRLLEKREEHLQRKVQHETAAAIEAKQAGHKQAALGRLKQKKLLEAELESLFQQRTKLETQEHTLQQLKFSQVTAAAERRATEAIRTKIAAIGGVEKLEDERAKTEETLEDAYELLGVAAQPFDNPALGGVTDEELLAELEEEEARELDATLLRLDAGSSSTAHAHAPTLSMPTPPSTHVARSQQEEQEERELAELDRLAASMGLAVERPMPMCGAGRAAVVADKSMPRIVEPMHMLMAPAVVAM